MLSQQHPIQLHILEKLSSQKIVRFHQLRPAGIDSNLFTYHLGRLVRAGMIDKHVDGYSLSAIGLRHVRQPSSVKNNHNIVQPNIQLLFVIQNSNGDILLSKHQQQPFIDTWGLPRGYIFETNISLQHAAQRTIAEELEVHEVNQEHAGDCYVRVFSKEVLITTTLVHVFRLYIDTVPKLPTLLWARPHKLADLQLYPATEHIMTRTFFNDPFYFEEFTVNWYTS